MDNASLPWHSILNLNVMKNVLNKLHPTFTYLDITILLVENVCLETYTFKRKRTLTIILIIAVIILTTLNITFPSIWQKVFWYLCQTNKKQGSDEKSILKTFYFGVNILFKLRYAKNIVKSINQKLKQSPNESLNIHIKISFR